MNNNITHFKICKCFCQAKPFIFVHYAYLLQKSYKMLIYISHRLNYYKHVTITVDPKRTAHSQSIQGGVIMKKIMKSVLLATAAFIMALTIFPSAALAEDSLFEPRLSSPSRSNPYYNRSLNAYSQSGYGMPNCTAYAYGRIYEITDEAPKISSGNAGSWWFSNKRNQYYEYGQEPKLGAIACWSGHVAVVEEINGNTVTISQSHWGRRYFDTTTYSNPKTKFRQTFYGYIYASDSVFEAEEEPVEYRYTSETSEFEIVRISPFDENGLAAEITQPLLMNSHMITNAII